MRTPQRFLNAAILAAMLVASSQASVITVSDTGSGWYLSDGSSNNYFGDGTTENYFAGYCSGDGCGSAGEHRNFFMFDIPNLDGPITSAVLTINTGGTSFGQSSNATYQVTSLPDSYGFNDLGTGSVYGSLTYTVDSTDADESIILNSSAISAINANSTFGVGGMVTSLSPSDTVDDQYLFGNDGIGSGNVELTITTANSPVGSDSPEPAAIGLCGAGLVAVTFCRFRKKNV